MNEKSDIPLFVSVITVLLGCYDLLRGTMHTLHTEYTSFNLETLTVASPMAGDLLHLLSIFGVSNYIIGVMLILIALKARGLALVMLAIIPFFYMLAMLATKTSLATFTESQTVFTGTTSLFIYLFVCFFTFLAGLTGMLYNKNNKNE
jgi:hypothetical protein